MSIPATCSQCGAALPAGAPGNRCPKCLLQFAFDPAAAETDLPPASRRPPHASRYVHYLGDYELLQEIARGGMGVVWKARQVSLNRIVAVKLLLAGKFSSPEFVKRFRAEAEAAANLQHPNIVAIHEVGEHEGHHYFSMDYVEGTDLAELAREKPLAAKRAATLLRTIAEAVHYAHQRGVLHRDLKPSNILIDGQSQPRVTDFGLAKFVVPPRSGRGGAELKPAEAGTTSDLTVTGQVLGTPAFMSPEQAGGKRGVVGPASDVYSLGAVLYFLVTGRAPFAADSLEETLRQIHETEPVSPRLLNPALPRDLETICLKSLNKEPTRRYASAQTLGEDLRRFLDDEPIAARPIGRPEKLWRWCRRKPALATLLLALLLVGTAGLVGILWQWRRAEQNADTAKQQSVRAEQHAASETAQRLRAEEAVISLELQRVEDLLKEDDVVMGVAYLARIVRQQPTNRIAAQRLLSALTQRNFALPIALPLRHNKRVWYAEFSPDGSRIVTAALDLRAAIWDARTGALVVALPHSNAVRFARFSPDGSRVLTASDDFRARLWDAATGRALGQSMAHDKKIHSAEFSPDGGRVLTASLDGTAQLWNAQTGERVLEPLRHKGPVNSARFSPDGQRLVTASDDKTAQVWSVRTGQPLGRPFVHSSGVRVVEFSSDGSRVVTGANDLSTCVWEMPSSRRLTKPQVHAASIAGARFSPEGERIVVALHSGAIHLFNARDWTPLAQPMFQRGSITGMEFGPEGQRVLTASEDNTARLWNAESGEPLTSPLEHDDLVFSAQFSADGMFAVTASADQTARVWDVRPGPTHSQLLPPSARWVGAVFSPDGETIVSMGEGSTARLWNARTGHFGRKLSDAKWVIHLRWSPSGQRVAAFCSDRTTRIWEARTGAAVIQPIQHGQHVTDLKFSPDGEWLATAGRDGMLQQWNTRTGAPRGEAIPHRDKIEFFAYSPDGQRLLCSDYKNDQARFHDAASGLRLAQTPERQGRVIHADISADGQRLVTASEDGIARIWRTGNLQPLTEPLRHKGAVLWAKFSRDGRRVVTASEDATARLWDAQSGQPVGEPLAHRAAVTSAEFGPDSLLVATASRDGTARLWDADTGRRVSEPFVHRGEVVSVSFSSDGRRMLTVSYVDGARAWDVPSSLLNHSGDDQPLGFGVRQSSGAFDTREPKKRSRSIGTALPDAAAPLPGLASLLLADLAEAVIGKRVNAQGALETRIHGRESAPLPSGDHQSRLTSAATNQFPDLIQIRQRVARLPADADFTRWLEWFFADRSTRPISPYSPVTVPQYTESLLQDTNPACWHEALLLCPTNATAFARLAGHRLRQTQTSSSTNAAAAEWASRQALKLAPSRFESWTRHVEIIEHTGAWTQLLAEAEQVIQAQTNNAYAWHSKARAHEALRQFDAVLPACDRALEICRQDPFFQSDTNLQRSLRFRRGTALRHVGRLTEAGADIATALGLALRPPQVGTNLIDLGAFYNGGGEQGFTNGVQRLAGTDFDVRGRIHLDLRLVWPWRADLPERVDGILIGRTCQRLHFLHTSTLASHLAPDSTGAPEEVFDAPLGLAVGRYVIHYADGEQADVPILHGRDVRDSWHFSESIPDDPALVVAWMGVTASSREHGATTRLYKQVWENPRPAVLIRSLDFVHARTHAVPILVAITVEP